MINETSHASFASFVASFYLAALLACFRGPTTLRIVFTLGQLELFLLPKFRIRPILTSRPSLRHINHYFLTGHDTALMLILKSNTSDVIITAEPGVGVVLR